MLGRGGLFLLLILTLRMCEGRFIKRAIDEEEEGGESNQIFGNGESAEDFGSSARSEEYGSNEKSGESYGIFYIQFIYGKYVIA